MFELVKSGGWLMLPIIACSIVALGIVFERLWSLQRKKVMPDYLMRQILQLHREKKLDLADLNKLRTSSPLGRILAAGLINRDHNKEVMKEAIEEVGRQVVHELERYLNTLGTIASISPLLGLLGTVIGMIKVFSVIVTAGVGDPGVLAGGISEALITTAAGLSVAIPSLMFHRYFSGLIDRLVMGMEEQALK
ncbi:MAG: MotA/TolQ/ExbB proton channel family protein, partial [Candidatus Thiodiazotropha sp. (ex Lucinoma kastoroae)]|nr:MotA/TolQ/ExbB proton channel family protein [Candidatus Thiodiazotropha sp. (ex Lucinoma kastoroae)]